MRGVETGRLEEGEVDGGRHGGLEKGREREVNITKKKIWENECV